MKLEKSNDNAISTNAELIDFYINLGSLYEQKKQWPSAIAHYRLALRINPNLAIAYKKLADLWYKLNRFDKAAEAWYKVLELDIKLITESESIAYYQTSISLSHNSVETYRKLAQVWLQLDKKTEAIASLEKAIALELELEDSEDLYQKPEVWVKAGDNLANAERWDEAILHYQQAIEIEPTYHQSYQNLGIALAKVGKIEDAIAAYHLAVELAPESGHNHYLLGLSLARIGQEEDAIATFRRAGELWEQQGKIELAIDAYQEILKLASNGDISFKLGMLHAQCGQFPEALTQYQQALQSQSGNPENYAKLAVIFVQQGLGKQVINCYHTVFQNKPESAKYYHNLGILLSQEGLIDAAVTCFRAAEKQPTEAEIYDTIWKSLNDLGQFNEHDPLYQIEIKLESALAHFSQTSQYRVIQMWSLTEADKEFLSSAGLSIEYLELMGRSDLAIEQIYVNSFPNDKLINFFTEEERAIATKTDNHYFQQSIAETGYFHISCPHSGRVLRSNQSFSMHCKPGYHRYQRNIYRFVGTEVFYLMCSPYSWQKNFIYFPRNDTVIILRPDVMSLQDYVLFSSFKAYAVTCWQDFKTYISSQKSKKTAILLGVLANIAHYLWIEIGGCEFLSQAGRLQKIEYFITGTWDYLKIGLLFPEISPEKIIPFPDNCDDFMIFQMLLKENYFVLTPSDFILTEKFVQQRIYPACVKKCSESFLQTCEEATTHFPLFLIQIRSHKRLWLSQVEGTANIIKKLYLDYPNLAVVFDGWTRVDGVEDPDEEAQIQRDQVVVDSIISLIPSTIPVYSTVGSTVYETIMFTKAIDLYMAIVGTGNTFEWIANKPGVVYLNTAMHNANVMRQAYLRENVIVPVIVSIDHIYNETNPADWNSNFDYDWQIIYNNLVGIIKSLGRKSDNEICQEIWQGLNGLCNFDEKNAENYRKITEEYAEKYFSDSSQYKVVDMSSLTEEDKDYLSNVGVCLDHVQLCEANSLSSEEMLIDHFQSGFNLAKKVEDKGLYYNGRIRSYFQQSIVETDYIYTVCPISGKILRSNQSFSIECPTTSVWWSIQFYRFTEGTELFYLISDDSDGHKSGIYIPKYDLLIILRTPYQKQGSIALLNKFKGAVVGHWQKFKAYISRNQKKEVAALMGFLQLPHFQVWVDLTGVHCLYLNEILDKVDKFLCSPYEFFDVHEVFPEIDSSKVVHLVDNKSVFEFVLENNLFVFRPADCFVREDLADRICTASLKKCSQSFLEEVESAKSCFPLLFVQFRRSRTWLNQIEGTANFINALHSDFPRLGVIFDGQTRLERCSNNEAENEAIKVDIQTMQEVLKLIHPEIKTYSTIGRTSYETVIMCMTADLHTGSSGNGVVFPSWIANKPGVGHTNTGFLQNGMQMDILTSKCRENLVEQKFVPIEHIADMFNHYIGAMSYNLDWQVVYKMIYEEVIKMQRQKEEKG